MELSDVVRRERAVLPGGAWGLGAAAAAFDACDDASEPCLHAILRPAGCDIAPSLASISPSIQPALTLYNVESAG